MRRSGAPHFCSTTAVLCHFVAGDGGASLVHAEVADGLERVDHVLTHCSSGEEYDGDLSVRHLRVERLRIPQRRRAFL